MSGQIETKELLRGSLEIPILLPALLLEWSRALIRHHQKASFEQMPWTEFMVAAVGGGQGWGSLRKFPQESLVGWLCLLFWILNYSVFVFLIYKKHCPWGLPWVFQTGVRNSVKIWPVRFRWAQDLRWIVLAKEGGYFPGLLFHWKIQTPRLEWAFSGSLLSHCPLLDPYAEPHPLPGDPMVGGVEGTSCEEKQTKKTKTSK